MNLIQNLNWTPTIGDPTVWGWITVLSYLLVSCLVFQILRDSSSVFKNTENKERNLWTGILILLIVLGINKQLDLQSLFIEIAKRHAVSYDWYHKRNYLQTWFISIFITAFLIAASALTIYFHQIIKKHFIAITGMFLLGSFVLIRATSIHKIDRLISMPVLGTKMNFLFEMTGLILIAINAIVLYRAVGPGRPNRTKAND